VFKFKINMILIISTCFQKKQSYKMLSFQFFQMDSRLCAAALSTMLMDSRLCADGLSTMPVDSQLYCILLTIVQTLSIMNFSLSTMYVYDIINFLHIFCSVDYGSGFVDYVLFLFKNIVD